MKRFIGLGSDHEDDIFDKAKIILEKEKPTVISLEQRISILNPGDSPDNPRLKERKKELLNQPNYTILSQGKKTKLKVNDLFVYGHPDSEDLPELSVCIDFALRNDLPFYFTEWSQDFPDYIFKFDSGKVQAIPLGIRYLDHGDIWIDEGEIIIWENHVNARNIFTASAINLISKPSDCLVHMGGYGHFDSTLLDQQYWLDEDFELQSLIKSEEKVVYNLLGKAWLEYYTSKGWKDPFTSKC